MAEYQYHPERVEQSHATTNQNESYSTPSQGWNVCLALPRVVPWGKVSNASGVKARLHTLYWFRFRTGPRLLFMRPFESITQIAKHAPPLASNELLGGIVGYERTRASNHVPLAPWWFESPSERVQASLES